MYSMYFVEITKIFQQSTVRYINKPHFVGTYLTFIMFIATIYTVYRYFTK